MCRPTDFVMASPLYTPSDVPTCPRHLPLLPLSARLGTQTLSMLECFEDMLSGRLPVAPPPSFGNPLSRSSVSSVAYRVPPSDFLKVLLAGNTTRIGALHAVLQVRHHTSPHERIVFAAGCCCVPGTTHMFCGNVCRTRTHGDCVNSWLASCSSTEAEKGPRRLSGHVLILRDSALRAILVWADRLTIS